MSIVYLYLDFKTSILLQYYFSNIVFLLNEITFTGDDVKSSSYPIQSSYPGKDQNIIFDNSHGQNIGWTSDSGKGIMLSPSMTGVRINAAILGYLLIAVFVVICF